MEERKEEHEQRSKTSLPPCNFFSCSFRDSFPSFCDSFIQIACNSPFLYLHEFSKGKIEEEKQMNSFLSSPCVGLSKATGFLILYLYDAKKRDGIEKKKGISL